MSNDLSIIRDVLGEELSPDSIDSAVRDAKSTTARLVNAWYPEAGNDVLPARRPGELSYFIPKGMWRPNSRGRELSSAYEEGLAALLYAHRIVINSPLLMLSSATIRGKPLRWRQDLLLTSLHLLHSLKELIDAGVVVIIGSDANYHSPEVKDALIAKLGRPHFDNLSYGLRHIIEFSLGSGCAVDLFTNSDAEYQQLRAVLGADHEHALADRSEAVHLSAFLEEVVPDPVDLSLREIVQIREDDSFQQWRTDLRIAIRRMITVNRTEELSGEGIEEVQALMREKAVRIEKAVARGSSMERLRGHMVSFAVGGIAAASVLPIVGQANVASEIAMLGGSLGVGALGLGLDAVRRLLRSNHDGSKALAHHYAFVGKCARYRS